MKYKTVGIICAMESEAKHILAALSDVREITLGNMLFSEGTLGKRRVVVAVCGIGKVFAAMCAQTMILHFSPDAVYNSGVAGSLTERLDILDVAVSDRLVQHDMDTSPLGDPVGLISGIHLVFLPAENRMADAVLETAEKMGIRTLKGTIASGDQFIATGEQKTRIKALFDPIACEMEGAAIAQVAYFQKTPFCAIRAISDSFTGQNEMDYALFAEKAAERGAALLVSLLKDDSLL